MSSLPPLPRRRVLAASAVVLVLAGGAGAWSLLRSGAGDAGLSVGGPFKLTDGQGRTVTDRDLRGRYLLVYFGYTYCPDVCPTTLNSLAGALSDMGVKADRLTPVFITVDPWRDTPKVIHDYVTAFSPRLRGLTGTPEQIAAVEREYRVYAARHVTGPGPNNYSMDHTSLLYLMDPRGGFVAVIPADLAPARMAAAIESHIT